ncbi:hypothetical protein GQ607_000128 [Colletotrichum asianum]|uniref:Uncharacterized protein n=1 Tax=Colletotrichum asianum TaxID=702518 RepID=A0A8H3WTP2_9PEZI|nr:hypothetical protein GQ607_000128 [Colletotrichum asianum]
MRLSCARRSASFHSFSHQPYGYVQLNILEGPLPPASYSTYYGGKLRERRPRFPRIEKTPQLMWYPAALWAVPFVHPSLHETATCLTDTRSPVGE